MSRLLADRGPLAILIRIFALPIAYPVLVLAWLVTGTVNPPAAGGAGPFPSIVDYILGDEGTLSVTSEASTTVALPVAVRGVLSLLAGAATVLNVTTFHIGGTWAVYLSAAVAYFAYIGIPPVTGDAFQQTLLSLLPASVVQTVQGLLGAGVAAGTILVGNAGWSMVATAIVIGVINELGALGFGPAGTNPVTVAT